MAVKFMHPSDLYVFEILPLQNSFEDLVFFYCAYEYFWTMHT